MTAATTAPMIDRALAVIAEVTAAEWPQSPQAQAAISFKLGQLDGILAERDALPSRDPRSVLAPDMGPDWDLADALAYLDDQALMCAQEARKRLGQFKAREDAEVLIAARQMTERLI